MRCVHFEDVSNWSYDELVFMSQVQAIEAIHELGTICHCHLFRMPVEGIERHAAEDGVAQRGHLLQDVAGRCFRTGLVPRSPLIHNQLDVTSTIELAHNLPMTADQILHAISLLQ